MAVTNLNNVNHYGESTDGKYYHDSNKPTKQNILCRGQPAWQVIQNSEDFRNGTNPPMDEEPDSTKFHVLRPQKAKFAVVIDVSGSMSKYRRLTRVQQSATDWIQYDVQNGSSVAIVKFSSYASPMAHLTKITGTNEREQLVNVINKLTAGGNTNLVDGLQKGLDELNPPKSFTSGGVIIYMTDGQRNRGPPLDTLKSRIIQDEVKIVTMAIGAASDPNLENLAKWSNGQTYFIHDGGGLDDLDNAFKATTTYQPNVPLSDEEIEVYDQTVSSQTTFTDSFTIDSTLGRDVNIKIGVPQTDLTSNLAFQMQLRNGSAFSQTLKSRTTSITFPTLEDGTYKFNVTSPSKTLSMLNIQVSSKASTSTALPLWTKCWISTGLKDVDASSDKLSIHAQVTNGQNPVMNADVWAYVEQEGKTVPIELKLIDDGSGADNVADDGIYSRFFAHYNGVSGRYTLRCQVKGNPNSSYVPSNFVSGSQNNESETPYGAYPIKPSDITTPLCCGSDTGLSGLPSSKTGDFIRVNNPGSFKVKNAPAKDKDVWPPNRVLDLKVEKSMDNFLTINFTAPGDDFDSGTPSKYNLTYSHKLLDPNNINKTLTVTQQVLESEIINGSIDHPLNATEKVVLVLSANQILNLTKTIYDFEVYAVDKAGNKGDPSNRASICNQCYTPPPNGASKHDTFFKTLLLLVIVKTILM